MVAARQQISVVQYKPVVGSQFNQADADRIGPVIERVLIRFGEDGAGAEALIEEGRPKSSPIHKEFDWDDEIAGHQWRLQQARKLFQSITIQIGKVTVRQTTFLPSKGAYIATQRVVRNIDMMQEAISMATKELEVWKHKHAILREVASFTKVFDVIDSIVVKK